MNPSLGALASDGTCEDATRAGLHTASDTSSAAFAGNKSARGGESCQDLVVMVAEQMLQRQRMLHSLLGRSAAGFSAGTEAVAALVQVQSAGPANVTCVSALTGEFLGRDSGHDALSFVPAQQELFRLRQRAVFPSASLGHPVLVLHPLLVATVSGLKILSLGDSCESESLGFSVCWTVGHVCALETVCCLAAVAAGEGMKLLKLSFDHRFHLAQPQYLQSSLEACRMYA